jgi:restriction system protein
MAMFVCRNPVDRGKEFWADENKGFVAIGWEFLSDLKQYEDREAMKAQYASKVPDANKWRIANHVGQLWRFSRDIENGDRILSPDRNEPIIHVGNVVGEYRYDPQNLGGDYPHIRDVVWTHSLKRTVLTQGALYELGGLMTVFRVSTHEEEINQANQDFLNGKQKEILPDATIADEEDGISASKVEELTSDFVLKRLEKYYKGIPLESLTANLLEAMGYKTKYRDRPGPDGGKDVIAHPDEFGFHSPVIRVEVKSHAGQAGGPAVQKLIGGMNQGENALFVSLGGFNREARMAAAGRGNVKLIDGLEFVRLIYEYYEQLDAEHKSRIPLQKVYTPDIRD